MSNTAVDIDDILMETEEKMDKSLQSTKHDFLTIRTGRANPAILHRIQVDYYGAPTPLQQLATISVPDPRTLVIQPFDKNVIADIDKAIQKSDLGINPMNDGKVIRLNIPPLTEERRKEYVKIVKKLTEDGKVAVRNVRRDAIEHIKKLEKDNNLPKDESKTAQDDIQQLTDQYIEHLEHALTEKEKEILEH